MNKIDTAPPVQQVSQAYLMPEKSVIIEKVLPYSHSMFCEKNKEVVLQGLESRSLYFIKKGAIEVSYTSDGTKVTVALIGAGNFFGEIGFIDKVSRVRDIRAVENAEIRIFNHNTMEKLLNEDPVLYGNFLTLITRSICEKFRRILEESEPLISYAASLSTGGHGYTESRPLPINFFQTSDGKTVNKVVEKSKAQFFDLSHMLQQDSFPDIREDLREKGHNILNSLNNNLEEFNDGISNSKDKDMMWGYVFKEIFPYFMRSRFAERAYYKPKGYAGDFLMIEMIYRNKPEGDGKLGTIIDEWCLNSRSAMAIRGRRKLLSREIGGLTEKKLKDGNPIQIMNLACGSNRELFDFLSKCEYSDRIEALCVDIDSEALKYTDKRVNVFPHNAALTLMTENLVKWSLGKVSHNIGMQDIIYSSGLMDYLDNRLFLAFINRCYDHLKPDGVLMVGNFAPTNPNRVVMDHILYWQLIHRDKKVLEDLLFQSRFGGNIEILAEEQEINLFIKATK
ncbi:MAG: hypothetical protein BA867_06930 [Desulfobacterales bacterium S5133MH16]|nr:MAG: hypothetical protein BA867_06930 [Desulfobacterales bacterium S5133MH16]